jgi:asparagine synthase (glutamine-hydrolysing)
VEHPDELMDADGRFASAIARRLNYPLRRVRSPRNFFSSSAYIDYLIASDAATPSLYLFISQLAQFIRPPSVWEGLIQGPTLKTPHQPPGGFDSFFRQECRSSDSGAWNNAREIFSPKFCDMMMEGFQADLRREIGRYSDDGYGVSEFVIRNRSRNRTATNPLKVYEGRNRAFLPGMTRDFFDIVGSISFDIRRNNAMYLELLKRFFPAALSVPIVSGGVLFKPSVWSGSYYINKTRAAIRRFTVNHPSAFRRLGYDPAAAAFEPSRFLDLTLLLDEDDPYIDSDHVRELARQGILSQNAFKLLFHWRAWHWLHQGILKERLSPWI